MRRVVIGDYPCRSLKDIHSALLGLNDVQYVTIITDNLRNDIYDFVDEINGGNIELDFSSRDTLLKSIYRLIKDGEDILQNPSTAPLVNFEGSLKAMHLTRLYLDGDTCHSVEELCNSIRRKSANKSFYEILSGHYYDILDFLDGLNDNRAKLIRDYNLSPDCADDVAISQAILSVLGLHAETGVNSDRYFSFENNPCVIIDLSGRVQLSYNYKVITSANVNNSLELSLIQDGKSCSLARETVNTKNASANDILEGCPIYSHKFIGTPKWTLLSQLHFFVQNNSCPIDVYIEISEDLFIGMKNVCEQDESSIYFQLFKRNAGGFEVVNQNLYEGIGEFNKNSITWIVPVKNPTAHRGYDSEEELNNKKVEWINSAGKLINAFKYLELVPIGYDGYGYGIIDTSESKTNAIIINCKGIIVGTIEDDLSAIEHVCGRDGNPLFIINYVTIKDIEGHIIAKAPGLRIINAFSEGFLLTSFKNYAYLSLTDNVNSEKFSDATMFVDGIATAHLKDSNFWCVVSYENGAFVTNNLYQCKRMIPLKGNYIIIINDDNKLGITHLHKLEEFCKSSSCNLSLRWFDDIIFPNDYSAYPDGYLCVCINGKFGFVRDDNGKDIPFTFDDARPFHEGCAAVKKESKWGFINSAGGFIVNPMFDELGGDSEHGVFSAKLNNEWGIFGLQGLGEANGFKRLSITILNYEHIGQFYYGLAPAKYNGKWGYISCDGYPIEIKEITSDDSASIDEPPKRIAEHHSEVKHSSSNKETDSFDSSSPEWDPFTDDFGMY